MVTVIFSGSRGRSDDTVASVRSGRSTRMTVKVPIGAVSGPLAAFVSRAVRSLPTKPIGDPPRPAARPNTELSPVPNAPQLETGTSRTKAFVDAQPGGHLLLPDVGRRSG